MRVIARRNETEREIERDKEKECSNSVPCEIIDHSVLLSLR